MRRAGQKPGSATGESTWGSLINGTGCKPTGTTTLCQVLGNGPIGKAWDKNERSPMPTKPAADADEPERVRVTYILRPALRQAINVQAALEDVPPYVVVERALEEYLQRHKRKGP